MNKEIGGYFEIEQNRGKEYYENGIALNSGRNCLKLLIRKNDIKRIWLPEWICDSVITACLDENAEVIYYPIDLDFRPVLPIDFQSEDWFYLVNYFGFLNSDDIYRYSSLFKNIIVDNVQAFFSNPLKGINTINSCRKFFGVPDGAYLFTDDITNDQLDADTSNGRVNFLYGRLEKSASLYYQAFQENEALMSSLPIALMSLTTHNILKGIDYDYVFSRRTENYAYLHSRMSTYNILTVPVVEGAFMYPLYLRNGDQLKSKLIESKVYVPTLWPNLLDDALPGSLAGELSKRLVLIPCDQRYNTEDMEYIWQKIESFAQSGGLYE